MNLNLILNCIGKCSLFLYPETKQWDPFMKSFLNDIYSPYQTFTMGDSDLSFTANFVYTNPHTVQVIGGVIEISKNNQVSRATGLHTNDVYKIIGTPPDNTLSASSWTIEGEGHIDYDELGNPIRQFTVGDGNAIITAHYSPTRSLIVREAFYSSEASATPTYTRVYSYKDSSRHDSCFKWSSMAGL